MGLTIVGVRHHSPACARLVRDTIARVRPRYVLIEGPSDMNGRIAELLLGHEPPVALFSFRASADGSRGSWSPFCAYSPEWVAIAEAHAAGATALFMDLPAWHDAFEGVENRYSDRHAVASERVRAMVRELGFENDDVLWDHLFEGEDDTTVVEPRLADYFVAIRGDEPAGDRDGPRERWMARHIAWAMARGEGDVVAVCGGFHAPALASLWEASPTEAPVLEPLPAGERAGSYLVPYSFRRLDAFTGYESGMPSPAFYQAVWEQGPEAAARAMLFHAVAHLRARAQRVSSADAIAAASLAEGLRMLRGRRVLARVDVLDGLAGALVKEALEAPLPWTRRGVLRARTDALIVELVAAFSGDRVGSLAPGTPRPPLVDDAYAELARVGVVLAPAAKALRLQLTDPTGLARSRVLHRWRILGVPGVELTAQARLDRGGAEVTEGWTVRRVIEADPALIEAAVHGATLEAATLGKLEDRAAGDADLAALASLLTEVAFAGLTAMTARLLGEAARIVGHEPSLSVLGDAATRLLALFRHDAILGAAGSRDLARVLALAFERGLWLFEGIQGGSAPADAAQVRAVRALRDCARLADALAVDPVRARAVCERRAVDPEAPPALRGAALGMLWSTADDEAVLRDRAVATLRAASKPQWLGDFLVGLFALAREEAARAEGLLAAMDEALAGMGDEDFLIAVPSLRHAFAYFPPREKLAIAEAVLALHGAPRQDPKTLLHLDVPADATRDGMRLDAEVLAMMKRYGLEEAPR